MDAWRVALAAVVPGLLGLAAAAAEPPRPPVAPGDDPGGYDWVQIDSGEWLPGKFLRMLDEKLYFDSEEFDKITFDWEDVVTLVSPGPHTFRIEGRDPMQGTFEMRNRRVRIETATGPIEVDADQILSLIPGGGSELDFWSFKASINFSGQQGNTDQISLDLRTDARRESPLTRWVTSYRGLFGSSNHRKTAESHRVPSTFDYFLTSRLFARLATLEYFSDEFQNIDRRLTAGSGVGYKLLETKVVDWEVGLGIAYQNTAYQSVVPGQDRGAHDAAVLVGTELNFDLPHDIDWNNSYRLCTVFTDLGKTSHHAESILDVDIWGPLDFELGFIFDRIERPRMGSDGVRPESNDYRVTAGIALEY